ncbi:ribonuclease P protein component [Candidatus Karelsulcia muelleri]|nr:ribonuclease P protein component [Candidatus Karelsulcia muelleri]WDI79487.1 ribonuclease P protein component [Candidatus Karelsulcia muelleri]WDR78945.1 ribonuclease P protein component [Candidatus Karelsulcia muelleri]
MNNLYQIFRKVKQIENNLLNVAYIEKEYNEKYRKKVKVALFVSKKQIIKSFKRNRIKRLMRMSYQLNKKIITLKKQKRYYLLFRYIKKKITNSYEITKCFEHVIIKIFGY